jgi:hypothetical protein
MLGLAKRAAATAHCDTDISIRSAADGEFASIKMLLLPWKIAGTTLPQGWEK